MATATALFQFLEHSAEIDPEGIAVIEPGQGSITYGELNALANQLRDRLYHLGVCPGDRVGIYLHKSIDSVAAIFGILKTGAAYVPVDPGAPVSRNAYILADCQVKAVVIEDCYVNDLASEWGAKEDISRFLILKHTGGGKFIKEMLDQAELSMPVSPGDSVNPSLDNLAYILYTSGSTGKPKGVMLTNRAAISFIDWCSEAFEPHPNDRFSSHAPFHFDLSILDLYLPIKHGASLVLISEEIGKDPIRLASLISESKITSWYSTPSILSFLAQYGRLERYDYSSLRIVHFAGEVFPVKHLRALKKLIPNPRYFNLYGPTETNVCTFFEIPQIIPEDKTNPFPIGKACSHYQIAILDERGRKVPPGEEGELCASGPGMMIGYWNLPEKTANAFLVDSAENKWYKTGDIAFEAPDGNYIYVARRDRMVKKRGYRIELGEIEAGLYRHPAIKEAAVIALQNDDGVKIKAFVSHHKDSRPSIIELKQFCAQNLPAYMVPDVFSLLDMLPKTSTDKIDYQKLKEFS
ncbi:MAG TPA: amino acid adenylation domain-containing protein [Anaerolineales bacterium]|nr:amino acid adenylation domain-containing protein [Anaerolineales bacterium]